MSLLIENGKIVEGNSLQEKNILIDKGKIKQITDKKIHSSKVIDATRKIILPGLIDSHVHFRDPGLTYKEDFRTGSHAAAAGGVTTVLDMPNTIPPTFTVKDLEDKREVAKNSIVNYGFHFGASPENNISEIEKAKNIASVKVYLDITTGNLLVNDFDLLEKLFSSIFLAIHAEEENVEKTIEIAKKLNKKFYLCHIDSEESVNHVKSNREHVFVEVSPHHLFLTEDDKKSLGDFSFVKPEIKTDKDREALWKALKTGLVDTIATDHAPHTIYEKKEKKTAGIPGVETMLPLLLNAVNEKKLTLQEIVKFCCHNPVKIFKIKNKGRIKEGFDADLTIVDMELKKKVKNEDLFTKCKWSPWHNKVLKGWPTTTIVNGNVVFDQGKIYDIKASEVQFNEL